MEQNVAKINETIVHGRRFRRLIDPTTRNWKPTDPNLLAEKYRLNAMVKFQPIDPSKVRFRGKASMDESFVLTEKFTDFNGRIITNESVLYNDVIEEPVCAEWDTGATYSSISKELAEKLQLKPCGKRMITSITSSESTEVYEISLILHNEVEIPVIVSALPNIHSHGVDFLIGMDVIHFGDFAISTYDNTTCFSFRAPSKGLIDFTKE